MRTKTIALTALVIAALVATVPLSAVAAHNENHTNGKSSSDGDDRRERHTALVAAKRAALDEFQDARKSALAEYRASLSDIREDYLAAKADVIAECRGDGPPHRGNDAEAPSDDNETGSNETGSNETASDPPANETEANSTALEATSVNETASNREAMKEEKLSFAHCVRDGLKPLKEEARAAMKEAHEKIREDLKAAKLAAKEQFRAAKADADATYGRRGKG